jgi:hypothetical protein
LFAMVTRKQPNSTPKRSVRRRSMRITSSKSRPSATINALKANTTTDASRGAGSNMPTKAVGAVARDARVVTGKTAIETEGIQMRVSRAKSYSKS